MKAKVIDWSGLMGGLDSAMAATTVDRQKSAESKSDSDGDWDSDGDTQPVAHSSLLKDKLMKTQKLMEVLADKRKAEMRFDWEMGVLPKSQKLLKQWLIRNELCDERLWHSLYNEHDSVTKYTMLQLSSINEVLAFARQHCASVEDAEERRKLQSAFCTCILQLQASLSVSFILNSLAAEVWFRDAFCQTATERSAVVWMRQIPLDILQLLLQFCSTNVLVSLVQHCSEYVASWHPFNVLRSDMSASRISKFVDFNCSRNCRGISSVEIRSNYFTVNNRAEKMMLSVRFEADSGEWVRVEPVEDSGVDASGYSLLRNTGEIQRVYFHWKCPVRAGFCQLRLHLKGQGEYSSCFLVNEFKVYGWNLW